MDSLLDFSFDIYRILSSENGISSDTLLSPLSMSMTLLILLYGSRGQTSREIVSVLFPNSIGRSLRRSDNGLRSSEKITFSASEIQRLMFLVNNLNNTSLKSGVFLDHSFNLNGDFESVVKHVFDAKLGTIDFSRGPEVSNQLISQIMGSKVKLPADIISRSTKMIILNRLSAKQNWKYPFDARRTKLRPFHLENGLIVPISTMINQLNIEVGVDEELNATLVKLPYEGARGGIKSYLILILPREGTTLKVLVNNLSVDKLTNCLQQSMETNKIKLYLPKFKLNNANSLVYPLQSTGLIKMFESQSANFTGLSNNAKGLFVGDFIQSNSIEINEVGSRIDSETLVSLKQRSLTDDIMFNRPFMFMNTLLNADNKIISVLQMGTFSGHAKQVQ